MSAKAFISTAALAAVTGLVTSTACAQITIPTVTIGNTGNPPDFYTGSIYGTVTYTYNIATTEVTNAQYAAFLNAKAASDPFGLYNGNGTSTGMASSLGGITRSGSPGSYTYSTVSGRANHPVNFVSFWDACRFANWLHNGQGNADTETGAYTLTPAGISNNTVTRNTGWRWAVTSENEWFKAAYYQPASAGGDSLNYWFYPTQSNTLPTSARANFNNFIGNTTPVGSYPPNYYGTFDMGGNVAEWNEAIFLNSYRSVRGGAFNLSGVAMQGDNRNLTLPTGESFNIGFRVSNAPGSTIVRCNPADIACDDGTPRAAAPGCVNSTTGPNEGDYNAFFAANGFFFQAGQGTAAIGGSCDIACDDGNPRSQAPGCINNGVNEGDYNCFFNNFFLTCS